MPTFNDDFTWQRRFMAHLKRIIGEQFISESPLEEDLYHNTDLLVLELKPIRVACRVRRYEYFKPYGDQFTIRSKRNGGTKTELRKILSGWGDYLLYAFADPFAFELWAWTIIDLNVFREWHSDYMMRHHGEVPGVEQNNGDGSSRFRAYAIDEIPSDALVLRYVND